MVSQLGQRGQIVVEYILLLAIAVAIATFITKQMIGRGDEPGFVIEAWQKLIVQIGADKADAPESDD